MISKKLRVSRKEIDLVFKEGRSLRAEGLGLRFLLTNDSSLPRVSFIAPKKVIKQAVKRNALRRRGYVAIKKYLDLFPKGFIGAFTFNSIPLSTLEIENSIKKIQEKIK